MHRYPAVSGGSGVGSNTSGGLPREIVHPDLGYPASSSFPLTSRRPLPLAPYILKCEQEPLSARLGPPDYFPPTPSCAEESLSRDACQNGYKETVDGIEESRETLYSLVNQQVWTKPLINKYKETIRKRLNLLNNSQLRKRKAGQVYGVSLSGSLLAKSGHFPEQRHSGEDNRKKWVEDLAQHKRLRVLADHVPHGLRRRPLFEALIKNNVPFLRATWCIKILYLNQVRPLSIGMSSGGGDKSQHRRVELWTKDVLEYMQSLLDEKVQHGDTGLVALGRENCALLPLSGPSQQANDFTQGTPEMEDPPLHKKWHYMLQILLMHFSEGLLNRPQVIDWVLKQLQERESLDATELLLPIVLALIDEISTCQTLVRMVVEISLHKLGEVCPTGRLPSASEQPRLHYVATFLAETLSYLLTVTPDSFVALDCFPLPPYVIESNNNAAMHFSECHPEVKGGGAEFKAGRLVGSSGFTKLQKHRITRSPCEMSISSLAAVVQKRAASLAKAVNPASLRKNEGTVVQALDKALLNGDIHAAYHCMFDDDFCGHEQPPDEWLCKLSPWLKLSPYFSGMKNLSEVFAVSFLCEWAICDFRDCRKIVNTSDQQTASARAVCRVHMAVSVLCLRSDERDNHNGRSSSMDVEGNNVKGHEDRKSKGENHFGSSLIAFFKSPGLIHDIIAAWIDQRELRKGEGFERLQLLLLELARKRLFWPPAYVRKLLVSGVLEKKETSADLERACRHRCLLQRLPSLSGLDMEEDGKKPSDPILIEALRVFRNERHFCLHGLDQHQSRTLRKQVTCSKLQQQPQVVGNSIEGSSEPSESRFCRESRSCISGKAKRLQRKKMKVVELKQAAAKCLHFPDWCVKNEAEPMYEKLTPGQGSTKRQLMAQGNSAEKQDATPGCEDCGRIKKLKSNEGVSIFLSGLGLGQGEEEGSWWVKKIVKTTADTLKTEPAASIKPPKQPARGRPKAVRKLSLSQLDAARIEGSQGASSSHTCDSKVNCPHHKSSLEASASKDKKKALPMHDLKTICSSLNRLRLMDRRAFAIWLDETVRLLIEGGDNVASVSTSLQQQPARPQMNVGSSAPNCEKSSTRWQCGEEELATIVFLLDKANDYVTLIRLLLWLLPKVNAPIVSSPGQSFKLATSSWNKDSACKIGESMVLACLRRYESVLLAANLLPEALSAGMQRAALLTPSGSASRVTCASLFAYLHDLHKKYGSFQSFQDWETVWKSANSQRLVVDFESLKTTESDSKLSLLGVNSPNLGDDRDDCLPSRSIGRFVKVAPYMRDIVRRGFQEVTNQMVSKEREVATSMKSKEAAIARWSEGLQAAQNVVNGLLDFIKQQAGTAPNGDVQLATTAASAVVSNVGSSIAVVFESFSSTNNSYSGGSSSGVTMPSSRCARRVLQAHVQCLRLLKESLGEKLHRVLESALAAEASSVVVNVIGHPSGRPPRPQYQLSPETPDPSSALGDLGAGSNGSTLGRSSTIAAAIAAFLVGLVLDDVVALERVVTLLRIKEGLESMQFSKGGGSNPNGLSRVLITGSAMKNDSMAEVFVFWLRVLIGDCRPVAGGLVAEILGESSMLAFLHRQRLLPLSTVFQPAYALFLIAIRGQHHPVSFSNREETSYQQLACSAIGELLVHEPFREVCLKDTRTLYLLLKEYEHTCLLDSKGADFLTKVSSMVPSRPRLFLHSVLDCTLRTGPLEEFPQGRCSMKNQASLVEELVQVLDDMHPATFHWQWLELRLLLNEQVFMEKLEGHNMSVAAEAVQAARSAVEEGQKLSESEKNFTEILLTRLLVRPDAAALYSEALRILGRAFEEYLILQVQWILENNDMLLGRKFLRQQLVEMAQRKKFKLSFGKIKVWEWLPRQVDEGNLAVDNIRKAEVTSLEEGEVAEEDMDCSKLVSEGVSVLTNCSHPPKKQFAIEKALADLVLPCLARSSSEIYGRFAFQLVKQISDLEQQVTLLSRASGRTVMAVPDGGPNKRFGPRKGPRAGSEMGSPGIGRWTTSGTESSPPSAAALQTSLWLRFRFLLLLLPPIYSDRERSMRAVLAPALLRLLGTGFVQERVEAFCSIQGDGGRDMDWNPEAAAAAAAVAAGEDLFDRILSVLHALLSSTWAVWLKQKPSNKPFKPVREVPPLDREVVKCMQGDLDHMQLPSMVRARLQAAMPILAPSPTPSISAGPASAPVVQTCATSMSNPVMLGPLNGSYRPPVRLENNFGKIKPAVSQETDTEIDPWTLLEDTNSSSGSGVAGTCVLSSENGSNKACAWLKGAVRVRRTDLTYVGSIDDDT
ncbi:hypothetical protein GOP47_0009111 [Adiantum capillus-veneris]|uniref:Mediator complex subunit Med12 domain-containing protein n=1 Tax=Adiantum capillus-veneris TaxID=13818 RepID=A0A9D4UZD3_ADICA|nr:hypothetical protein GOP47_0008706 [Adiantum capillus-veneris]KAI5077046.1 hypothetical protein GOP47_0009111 [Adiantum capillus-veneris]